MLLRWITGLPVAGAVTAGLFLLMALMVAQTGTELKPARQTVVDILPKIKETPPEGKAPKPPIVEEKPPETHIPPTLPGEKPEAVPTLPGELTIDADPPAAPGLGAGPIIRHKPSYPEACRSRNAEGVVLVQFDVTPEGDVVNVRILESANACFDRTVRNTVSKWKYPPSYEGGAAVMRYGVVERFNFQLTD